MKKGTGWKLGTIGLAGSLTMVTATLAGVGGVALNILPTKPQDLSKVDKINYVALGDGLTSGANMLVGEDYVSFADFFASDLKNANRLGTYENFADSSNKIFDVLNGALMNGAQREAIKNADLITITAGTNDLLAMMELFGVPLADLSTNEERDRGGLNNVTSLEDQYAERQNKVVDVLEAMGKAIDNQDFSGAISIDENVYKDLFLAVNLNLTLLTTEIAKIAPGAKIVLLSPFNPVEGLPTSLTDAPLGNGGMSFNQLFSKLIDTYDTVAKLNPACEHINMGNINDFKNNTETFTMYQEDSDAYGEHYALTKQRKRFNDIDMNPSTYGHELIGNGLFKMLSGEMGIHADDSILTTTRVADADDIAEPVDGTSFKPELYDESNNGDLQDIKATFVLAEQVLEALDTVKYGSHQNDVFEVKSEVITLPDDGSGDIHQDTEIRLVSNSDEPNWMQTPLLQQMLQGQMIKNSPMTKLMSNLLLLVSANDDQENDRLSAALKGQLKLSTEKYDNAMSIFNSMVGTTFRGTDTTIRIGANPVVTKTKTYSANSTVNINDEFGVFNISELYGMIHLTDDINIISNSWNNFFVANSVWYNIAITTTKTTANTGSSLVTAPSLFAYTSPLWMILDPEQGIDDFKDRVMELGLSGKIDADKIGTELSAMTINPTFETNPAIMKDIVLDIYNTTKIASDPTFTPLTTLSKRQMDSFMVTDEEMANDGMLIMQDVLGNDLPRATAPKKLPDGSTNPAYTAENDAYVASIQDNIAVGNHPSAQDIAQTRWDEAARAYISNPSAKYPETVKAANIFGDSARLIKEIMFS